MKGKKIDFLALLAFGTVMGALAANASAFDVDSSAGPNGSIDPAGRTHVSVGSDLVLAATPKPGFLVDTWYVDSKPVQTGGEGYTLTNIRAYHKVHVTFKAGVYIVNATARSDGAISPAGDIQVNHG